MKQIIFFGLMLLNVGVFAQQGKERRLLPSEVSPLQREVKSPNRFALPSSYSEVFIRMMDMGRYRIGIGDQMVENSTGLFRFFDLSEGKYMLNIYDGNHLIYRTSVFTKHNQRLVLDFSEDAGLFVVDEFPINYREGQPAFNFPKYQNNRLYGKNLMNPADFETFFRHFKKESFDDNKMKLFQQQKNYSLFTAEQIVRLLEVFSFDSGKLPLAKMAYEVCVNPENYYKVIDKMTFSSAKQELNEYISQMR